MISAKADGPPQWQAAPPLTAWTSISATSARVARGSATVHSRPAMPFTVRAYFGLPGVPARRGFSARGLSGGASTALAGVRSAAMGVNAFPSESCNERRGLGLIQSLRQRWDGGTAKGDGE